MLDMKKQIALAAAIGFALGVLVMTVSVGLPYMKCQTRLIILEQALSVSND